MSIGLNTKTMYIWASVTYIFHIIYQSACVQSIYTSLDPVKRILLHFKLSNVENIQSAKFSIIKLKVITNNIYTHGICSETILMQNTKGQP